MLLSLIFGLAILGVKIYIIYYIYNDCIQRGESPLLWMILAFLTSALIALIIYSILRDRGYSNY